MLAWLKQMIELKNFGAILEKIEANNSLMPYCKEITRAVNLEMVDPDGDPAFCLLILKAMNDKGWDWA